MQPACRWLIVGMGALMTCALWFDNNRSLAVSLVSAGMGVAPMTVSP